MTTKSLPINAIILCAALLWCGGTLAQEPVQDINKAAHPNLANAQRLVAEANKYVEIAQKDNKYDMNGHAAKARQLMAQVNQELKLAAQDADAANQKKK